MRRLELTPAWAAQVRDVRVNRRLGMVAGAEALGVSIRVFRRWCAELDLSAPPSLGRPRTHATPADKLAARRKRYAERGQYAAD